jgi:unsaturated rhamnogalacturonyl hydrolase
LTRELKKNNYIKLLLILILLILISNCKEPDKSRESDKGITSQLLADNFIALHPDTVAYRSEAKSYKWNYEQGLILEAIYRVWQQTKDQKYFDYIKKNIDYYVQDNGSIKTYKLENFNLDNIAPGRLLLHLYAITKQDKYKKAADLLIRQLQLQPRISAGGFWHKKIYPNQMWLDGLYMAEPFYAEYSAMFADTNYFNDISKQFLLIKKHSYDQRTGLYYHGWDESREQKWADPINGTSPNFWGRSLGWLVMALVDVIDSLPDNNKDKNELLIMFQQLSSSLLKYRDEQTKLWFQVIDNQNQVGNYIETSASCMFIYAYAKGYNKGYLSEDFLKSAEESFSSITKNFITQDDAGHYVLTNVCSVGGLGGKPYRDGSFEYYISEPKRNNDFKGYGALILAASELNRKTK